MALLWMIASAHGILSLLSLSFLCHPFTFALYCNVWLSLKMRKVPLYILLHYPGIVKLWQGDKNTVNNLLHVMHPYNSSRSEQHTRTVFRLRLATQIMRMSSDSMMGLLSRACLLSEIESMQNMLETQQDDQATRNRRLLQLSPADKSTPSLAPGHSGQL